MCSLGPVSAEGYADSTEEILSLLYRPEKTCFYSIATSFPSSASSEKNNACGLKENGVDVYNGSDELQEQLALHLHELTMKNLRI